MIRSEKRASLYLDSESSSEISSQLLFYIPVRSFIPGYENREVRTQAILTANCRGDVVIGASTSQLVKVGSIGRQVRLLCTSVRHLTGYLYLYVAIRVPV